MERKKPKFIRQDSTRYSKIGKNRKKLQKWRNPRGRHSKMRLKRKSYPVSPSVGYKSSKIERGMLNNKSPILAINLKDILNATSENIIIISSKVGAKKKLEMLKLISEKKLEVFNLNKGNKK